MLMLLLNLAGDGLANAGYAAADEATGWVGAGLLLWIPVYLLLSLRQVYRQNWFLTVFKYGVIGISYLSLLGIVTAFVALLSFLLL